VQNWQLALVVGCTIGLILAPHIRRGSLARQPIHGGLIAQMLHFAACVLQTSATPVGFAAALLLRDDPPLARLVIGTILALGCSLAGLLLLIPFGIFKNYSREHRANRIQ
jgi:hypothetical protein